MTAEAGSSESGEEDGGAAGSRGASAPIADAARRVRSAVRPGDGWRTALVAAVETEAAARTGFLLIPIGLAIGSVAVFGGGWRPFVLPAFAFALVAALAGYRLPGSTVLRSLLVLAAFIAAGGGLATWEIERTQTTILSGEATVRILGRVQERQTDERGRQRYLIAVEETRRPVLSRPPDQVRITVSSDHVPIAAGGIYDGLVRISRPSGPVMPGAYDFAFKPFFDGLGAYGFSLGAPSAPGDAGTLSPQPIPERAFAGLSRMRTAIADRIRTVIGGPEGAIAAALVTGQRAAIPDDAARWMRGTGLAHVLSISGLHMAIVAGFALLVVRSGLAFLPGVAMRLPVKKIAAVVALVVATLYLTISGGSFATQRSFIMLGIMLCAVMLDRPAITLRNVAIAAIVILVVTPHAVMSAGFQMSFLATVALVGGYGAWTRHRRGKADRDTILPKGWMGKAFGGMVGIGATSILAGSATAPFAAYHFHRVAAFGLLANLLTMPLFSLWIMPLALIACLAMPFGLDAPFLNLMGMGVAAVLSIARWIYTYVPDQAVGRMSVVTLILFVIGFLAAACLASRLRWIALPIFMAGAASATVVKAPPDLIVYEDAETIARLGEGGSLAHLEARPSGFVADQWDRMFAQEMADGEGEIDTIATTCVDAVCTFQTRSGLTIAWTDDWRMAGAACDRGDVAIVARASIMKRCRSGAILATKRTLRRTGSLAIYAAETDGARAVEAVGGSPAAWNQHRLAPWPEYWENPDKTDAD